ncbi:MAG TPA: copper amine oxidase N-terminal domain-containing protein [Candidatus Nitrosotenuis sp.]|jgi:hypothetical protein|nr:copper amine oxidase N-terminal domain-containing protein [Candidatus Nitrosotenuis sp.]
MRRLFLTVLILSLLTLPALAAGPQVLVDGRPLPGDAPALRQGGAILVPMRAVFDALGARVAYDPATRTIRGERAGRLVELRPGSARATVNGREVPLEVPALERQGRVLVPLRFVAEALGAKVSWEAASQTVRIASQGGDPSVPLALPAPAGSLGSFDPAVDLARIMVGNQAGILKILDRTRQKTVVFRTLDNRLTAPVTEEQRQAIWQALGLTPASLVPVADTLMARYGSPRRRESLALLGAIASAPQLEAGARARITRFLSQRMRQDPDVAARRQAALSLALSHSVDQEAVEAVLAFYGGSDNLWETFPVAQFFEYHAHEIKAAPYADRVRQRVAAVNSLYTPQILSYLQ